ncbi:MAG: carbohydrate kinase family protein, partial [Sciscionella sp.]
MIVVGGEALVDLVPLRALAPAELGPLMPAIGGGPYNVALSAGRLGAPTAFLSCVSRDRFGDALLSRIADSGVDTTLVQRSEKPTTLAVVDLAEDGSAGYTFHTDTADRQFADPGELPRATTVLSLGTLGMVLEPGASAYERTLRRASKDGLLTVLDPNIRPALICDPTGYRARFRSWLPDLGVVKASEEDARWLAGLDDDAPLEPVPRSWLDVGASAVVLTRGADGLTVFTGHGRSVAVPAAASTVADTIGAGDTVHGALLAWFDRHA